MNVLRLACFAVVLLLSLPPRAQAGPMYAGLLYQVVALSTRDTKGLVAVAPELGLGFESGRGMYVVVSAHYTRP